MTAEIKALARARARRLQRGPPQDLLENVVFGCSFKAKRLNPEQLRKSWNLEQPGPGPEPGTKPRPRPRSRLWPGPGPGGSKGVPHRICSKMLFLAVLLCKTNKIIEKTKKSLWESFKIQQKNQKHYEKTKKTNKKQKNKAQGEWSRTRTQIFSLSFVFCWFLLVFC